MSEIKLDLGCGSRPKDGFSGVDIVGPDVDFLIDLASGHRWHFQTSSVDALASSHFIEHIPAEYVQTPDGGQDALFWFFDEAWRIAKPGALFELRWPGYNSVWAFQDPTHRRFIPVQALAYLSIKSRAELGVSQYNVRCDWEIVSAQGRRDPAGSDADPFLEMFAVLRCKKD
jgi:hypothetical protein